jgi:tRNA threonylcarbamoyladenosine biosynthesis protein TsaB
MLLLSADTSGKNGSIALAQCGAGEECEILEVVPLAGGTFSAQLVPQIAALLRKHGFAKQDIGAFAVVSGPGSFTGLRVGLAAIKALAEVLLKPIAAISLLEAVAMTGRAKGRVLAALDAGRNEIYAGEYEITAGSEMLSERLLTRGEFVTAATGVLVTTPNASVVEFARGAGLQVEEIQRPGSHTIARLGWKKIQNGQIISADALEANYLRRSDAEIFSKVGS